jgi:hypothetical protein
MVLAIASASVSYHNNDKNHQRAWALVSEALTYAEEVLRPGSITGIQAILLLAQYSLVDPVRFRSWYLVGMAVKVAIDLGLHQDPPAEVLTNPDRLDIRRRVFHCIYCLDRFVLVLLLDVHPANPLLQRIESCYAENLLVLRRICECCVAINCRTRGPHRPNSYLPTQPGTCFAYRQNPTDSVRGLPTNALQWARSIPAAPSPHLDFVLASPGVVPSMPQECSQPLFTSIPT